ncbi:acyltransferase [Aeromicrobium alkaliterrae]|uniref:Acyltransferase 3 domain-containing protein n=1 Tax=Aeromicrobium alkaliterrae TaxID=302168 RepID=A0ABP4VP67_9ACTN
MRISLRGRTTTSATASTEPVERRPEARFLLLDLARLLAALAVVLYHFVAREHDQWGSSAQNLFPVLSQVSVYGFLGVQLFFVISGFVILMSVENRSVRQFAAARAARLFPAYWVAVLATAALLVWIAPQLHQDVSLSQVLVNLTLLQTPLGIAPVDGVYWTLWVEVTFYAAIALLVALGVTGRGMTWFMVGWPVAGLAVSLLGNEKLIFLLAAEHAPWFAAGMCLYLMHRHGRTAFRWAFLVLVTALAVRQTLAFNVPDTEPYTDVPVSRVVAAVLAVAIVAVMTVVTQTDLKSVGRPWMITAGALTYPLYLLHEYWGWWMIGLVQPVAGHLAALAAALLLSLLMAHVVAHGVERPVRPRLRRALEKLLARP